MKNINLTNFEAKVILDNLNEFSICHAGCYCDYVQDLCNIDDKNGDPKCKLVKAIYSIREKLGEEY